MKENYFKIIEEILEINKNIKNNKADQNIKKPKKLPIFNKL